MAEEENVHLPQDFFDREQIRLKDIRTIFPRQKSGFMLQTFAEFCQRTSRTKARWKKFYIHGDGTPLDEWGEAGRLGLTNMIQSGLLANVEDLTLSRLSDFGDEGMVALAESLKSGHLSSLRHLRLHNVGFLEVPRTKVTELRMPRTKERELRMPLDGAKALRSWLESDHARTLETLSIQSQSIWSSQALALLLQSLKKGAMGSLSELDLRCFAYDSLNAAAKNQDPKLAIVAELLESLRIGQVDTLRQLTLNSTVRGYGIPTLASLAQCSQLRGLEYLDLECVQSGREPRAKRRDHQAAMALAFQANKLQNLEELQLEGEMEDDEGEILFSAMEAGNFNSLRLFGFRNPKMTGRQAEAMSAKSNTSGHRCLLFWEVRETRDN